MFKRPLFFSATSSKFYCQDPPYNIRRTESHSVPIYSIDKKYVLIRSFFLFSRTANLWNRFLCRYFPGHYNMNHFKSLAKCYLSFQLHPLTFISPTTFNNLLSSVAHWPCIGWTLMKNKLYENGNKAEILKSLWNNKIHCK